MTDGASADDEHIAFLGTGGESESYIGQRMEVDDLDGDGVNDLAVLDKDWPYMDWEQRGRLYVVPTSTTGDMPIIDSATAVLNTGTSGFDELIDFVLPGDLTGDGQSDLVVAMEMDGAFLLAGPVSGTMDEATLHAAAHTHYVAGTVMAIDLAGDVDGDGQVDLAMEIGFDDRTPAIYFSAPGGTMAAADAGLTVTYDKDLRLAEGFDANRDGLGELVFISSDGFHLFQGR